MGRKPEKDETRSDNKVCKETKDRIEQLMKALGLNQVKLAAKIQMSRETIRRVWEKGVKEDTLKLVACVLGVEPFEIDRNSPRCKTNIEELVKQVKKGRAAASRQESNTGISAQQQLDRPQNPHVLQFGLVRTHWVSLHGTGDDPLVSRLLRTELINEQVRLPGDLERIRDKRRDELKKLEERNQSRVWNGKRFSLIQHGPTRSSDDEVVGVCFGFRLTDYAAFDSITKQMDKPGLVCDDAKKPTTIRDKWFSEFDPDIPNEYCTHSFGINLSVITSDRQIAFVQRSKNVANKPGQFHIAMNEGMKHPDDLDGDGRPSFLKTAQRGLREELGLNESTYSPEDIQFTNFGALAFENEYGILGHVCIPFDYSALCRLFHDRAKDKGQETQHQLYMVQYDPDAIIRFVTSHRPWSHNALATIYYTIWREWGYDKLWEALKNVDSRSGLVVD